ncbi:trypsin-like peptidase domain-containing protein [Streptomyces griseoaurantiacus]|uniref:trypsin-like peptidase domain-containing protein n=1 Tax=Streptomyces griseoaurantiacus TaxID=68213 RepID=UPI003F4CB52F
MAARDGALTGLHDPAPTADLLVQIFDPVGRPRGTGFAADPEGTLVTSHEAVDGAARLLVRAGDAVTEVTGAAITPLPRLGLALLHTRGLGGPRPLPVAAPRAVGRGAYVRIAAGGWREARVLGTTTVTYTASDGPRLLDGALELALGTAGTDALRPGGGAAGGPVLDAETGAVLGVLGTTLHTAHRTAGFALPLTGADGPLAALLARNAATVPAYGADLNLAGAARLTAAASATRVPAARPERVPRAEVTRHLETFAARGTHRPHGAAEAPEWAEAAEETKAAEGTEAGGAAVLALVGPPGSGRTTELAALAAHRAAGAEASPTLWLRGSDLLAADPSLSAAASRALARAAVSGGCGAGTPVASGMPGTPCAEDLRPERLARVAREGGRPLLLLLDAPEEMPDASAERLPEWAAATAAWLRTTGARLILACRPEYWERLGAAFPRALLYGPGTPAGRSLPPCVALGDLSFDEARLVRARHGIPDTALAPADARHPLTLRLLAEVRAECPEPGGRPDRHEILSAHLDLVCLRVAARLTGPAHPRGTAVRRLAAHVAGQVHAAARRCLGPGQGALDEASFALLFSGGATARPGAGPGAPARAGIQVGGDWVPAVLAEGLFVRTGDSHRFAHEELGDWLQGMHLDVEAALDALVLRGASYSAASRTEWYGAARPADGPAGSPPVPPAPSVPPHRIGPVVEALLLLARDRGTAELTYQLGRLVDALEVLMPAEPPAADLRPPPGTPLWWALRLLAETLLRVPDATPYTAVLDRLARRILARYAQARPVPAELGPPLWEAVRLRAAERFDLLRRLVVTDPAPGAPGDPACPRFLDAAARLLTADPAAVQPQLTRWFEDDRPLPATPHATVATAAQALLYTHRHGALDHLTEALADSAHPRGEELLAVLAEEEPSAMRRAVERWERDERPARRAAAVRYAPRARAREAGRALPHRTSPALPAGAATR